MSADEIAKLLPNIKEAEFLRQVIQLAKLCRWLVAHFRPARTDRGWRTAVQGDGVGWPDLALVRGPRFLVAELKCGKNKTTPEQEAWLNAFQGAGIPAFVWYPEDWETIKEVLA